ncbi:MAG: fatty acid desaturase [Pseudomonadota bacterium]
MPMTKDPAVREVLNQIISDPDYGEVAKVPFLSLHQFSLVALCWLGAFASVYGYFQGWFGAPVAVAIMFVSIFISFTPMHDAAHQSLSSNRFLNDLLGTISVQLLLPGANMPLWRTLHMEHHRYVGDEEYDPDDKLVNTPRPFGILYLAFTDLHWVHWYYTSGAKERLPARTQYWLFLTLACLVVSHVGFLLSPYWWEFLVLYVLPQRLGLWAVVYSFAYIQHPHGLSWEEQAFQSTVRIKSNPLVRLSLMGQADHCMHHLLPHLPWYRYGPVWDFANGALLRQNIPHRGYLTPAKEIILPDPLGSDVRNVRVTRVQDVAKDIRSYTFEPLQGDHLPTFSAGSHINLHLPSGAVRQYSLLNAPFEQNRYQIAVKRDDAGRGGSKEVHEVLKEGGIARIGKPHNNFVLYEKAKRTVLIAGGIGITPTLSMAHRLMQLEKPFVLHICARSEEHLPFAEELRNWAFAPNVEVHFDTEDGRSGFDADRILANHAEGELVYICGPGGFMEWVTSVAKQHGWSDKDIVTENFSAAVGDYAEDKAFTLNLAKSKRQLEVASDENLIDALHKANIKVPFACMQGTCGTCLTGIVEGEADHRDAYQSDHDKSENKQMCLCVSRAKGDEITLDL